MTATNKTQIKPTVHTCNPQSDVPRATIYNRRLSNCIDDTDMSAVLDGCYNVEELSALYEGDTSIMGNAVKSIISYMTRIDTNLNILETDTTYELLFASIQDYEHYSNIGETRCRKTVV